MANTKKASAALSLAVCDDMSFWLFLFLKGRRSLVNIFKIGDDVVDLGFAEIKVGHAGAAGLQQRFQVNGSTFFVGPRRRQVRAQVAAETKNLVTTLAIVLLIKRLAPQRSLHFFRRPVYIRFRSAGVHGCGVASEGKKEQDGYGGFYHAGDFQLAAK